MACLKSCECKISLGILPAVISIHQELLHTPVPSWNTSRGTTVQQFLSTNHCTHWKKRLKESWGFSVYLGSHHCFLSYESHCKERSCSEKKQHISATSTLSQEEPLINFLAITKHMRCSHLEPKNEQIKSSHSLPMELNTFFYMYMVIYYNFTSLVLKTLC